jgi:hypothetical protein
LTQSDVSASVKMRAIWPIWANGARLRLPIFRILLGARAEKSARACGAPLDKTARARCEALLKFVVYWWI